MRGHRHQWRLSMLVEVDAALTPERQAIPAVNVRRQVADDGDSGSADAFEFSQRAIQGVGQHIPRDFPEADRLGLAHGRAPAVERSGKVAAGVGLCGRERFGDACLRDVIVCPLS